MIDWNEIIGDFSTTLEVGTNPLLTTIFYLIFLTTIIVLYSIFVFYFYKFLAKKDILTLNLNRFNNYSHPGVVKFFAFIFYVIEFIILLPILIFIWFTVFSVFLLVLGQSFGLQKILLITAALVASVRIISYINSDLSEDLAKLIPLNLLAISMITPGFFNFRALIERVKEIPILLHDIIYFLVFIIAIEIMMRIVDLFTDLENFSIDD